MNKKHIILIAEDNRISRKILVKMFSKENDVLEAENGQQTIEILENYKDDIIAIILDLRMPEKDGYEVLSYIKEKGLKRAVATATALDLTKERLTALGIAGEFDAIISAKTVEWGKPQPDVYLYACEQIEEVPGDCLAVEDSPNGILSAYRAGCKPVLVPDLTDATPELEPFLYDCVPSLTDLKNTVERCLQE